MMISVLAIFGLEMVEVLFLGLYALAFVVTTLWSLNRFQLAQDSFNSSSDEPPTLENPIDVAFLAAGVRRSAQVAILSLLDQGALVWQPKGSGKNGRLLQGTALKEDAHRFEKSIYAAVANMGKTGLPLTKLGPSILNAVHPVEGNLARLGLRPTDEERSEKMFTVTIPLWILFSAVALKLVIELLTKEPIGLSILLLVVTATAILIIQSRRPRLSPEGQKMLARLRSQPSSASTGLEQIALFGWSATNIHSNLPDLDQDFMQEIQQKEINASWSVGCGGSTTIADGCSGCTGGSGCGGGCGGCGGS